VVQVILVALDQVGVLVVALESLVMVLMRLQVAVVPVV
jgi:hypothetical protein